MLAAIIAEGVGTLLVLALPAYELRAIDWEFIVDTGSAMVPALLSSISSIHYELAATNKLKASSRRSKWESTTRKQKRRTRQATRLRDCTSSFVLSTVKIDLPRENICINLAIMYEPGRGECLIEYKYPHLTIKHSNTSLISRFYD